MITLLRDRDEVAVVALAVELACWQAAYPQERAEGPLQLLKAAELMATVMARLHSERAVNLIADLLRGRCNR